MGVLFNFFVILDKGLGLVAPDTGFCIVLCVFQVIELVLLILISMMNSYELGKRLMYLYLLLIELICLIMVGDQNGKVDKDGVLNGSWLMYVCTSCMKLLVLIMTLYKMNIFFEEKQKNKEKNK